MITPVDEETASTLAAVARFNAAFDRHDVDGVMAASTACTLMPRKPHRRTA